jgi:TPR repeat protein
MRISKLLVPLAFLMLFSNGVAAAAAGFDESTEAEYKEALAKAIPMAEQGDAEAQYNIGVMYAEGLGVLENDRTGAKWLTLAAEQGYADAQYKLAIMFANGEGVLENHKTAYRWAKLAAAQEHADAQNLLGLLAGTGEDWIRSYMWFTLATYNDAEEDFSLLKIINSIKMTPAEVDMAQEMASRCLESNYTDC